MGAPPAGRRPGLLRRRDPPGGPIIGFHVDDLAEKEAILQAGHDGLFATPHLDGYPSVLVELDEVDGEVLEALVIDAWLCRAPKRAVAAYLAERDDDG